MLLPVFYLRLLCIFVSLPRLLGILALTVWPSTVSLSVSSVFLCKINLFVNCTSSSIFVCTAGNETQIDSCWKPSGTCTASETVEPSLMTGDTVLLWFKDTAGRDCWEGNGGFPSTKQDKLISEEGENRCKTISFHDIFLVCFVHLDFALLPLKICA